MSETKNLMESIQNNLTEKEQLKEEIKNILDNPTYVKIVNFIDNNIYNETDEDRKIICQQLKNDLDIFGNLNESEELNPVNKDIEQILNSITILNNNIQTNEGKEVLDRLVETLANTVNKLGIEIDNDLIG